MGLPLPQAFLLTDRLLATHRSGSLLCVDPSRAIGSSFAMQSERPRTFERWPAGRAVAAGFTPSDDGAPSSSESSVAAAGVGGPMVAVVRVRGLLSSEVSAWDCGWSDGYSGDGGIVEQVTEAMTDPNVVAVVLDVMSPGGDALGCGEAASALAALRAAVPSKPLLSYARQACSAAYWLASAAAGPGGLFVSQSSDVGNVGTWTAHVDMSKANENDGIKVTYVASPPGKVLGNPDETLPKAALERMQSRIDETTARFCASVAEARGTLSAANVMGLDGDTRRGADAVAAGLADGVAASLDDVVALAYSRAVALRPPTITTGAVGAHPSPFASKGSAMFSPVVLAALGLGASATDAQAETAALARISFANAVLADLGEADPERASGKLKAKLEEAKAAPELRAQLAAVSAVSDSAKRSKLIGDAVADGRLSSGQAYAWSEEASDGSTPIKVDGAIRHRSVKRFLATQSTAQLEGYLEGLPAIHAEPATPTPDEQAAIVGANLLSKRDTERAKRAGVDPVLLSAILAHQQRGASFADQEEGT